MRPMVLALRSRVTVEIDAKGGCASVGPSAPPGRANATTADVLMQMLALCPDNMIGKRDRARLAAEGSAGWRWME